MPKKKRFCINGHDTTIVGRRHNNGCRQCERNSNRYRKQLLYKSNPELYRSRSRAKKGSLHSEYVAWISAKQRVTNPNNKNWKDYGGRGITMDPEWLDSFESFIEHIGPKPDSSLTLDRIDNNGNYEPNNVRWATRKDQTENRRSAD